MKIYIYAKSKGYILPTVYQSNYNLVARKNEALLFPTLRDLNISIHAYSPIAGGFLVKTPSQIENGTGRWDPASFAGKLYQKLYNKPSYLKYLEDYDKLAVESGAGRVGMAYRWVRYHSTLDGSLGDTIVIGASTPAQLNETLIQLDKGPLDNWVADKLNELWLMVEPDAPVDNFKAFQQLFL